MKLQDIYSQNRNIAYEAIISDRELAIQIQTVLIGHDLLEPPVDGSFQIKSISSLKKFQKLLKINEACLGAKTAEALIETKEEDLPEPELELTNDLASKIVRYMLKQGYIVDIGPQLYNIVYLEGANEDGSPNADELDIWNDRRIVIEVPNNKPKIVANYLATSEPGAKYVLHPLNPEGAARIAFSQYRSWMVGLHKDHEALIQVADVKIHRDRNRDGSRSGDPIRVGCYGINQHWGYDMARVGGASAGCLCGQSRKGHRQFMALIKRDPRYLANRNFIYRTTIIPVDVL